MIFGTGEVSGSNLVRFCTGRTLAREAALAGFSFTDRYSALGIPVPDPNTMCKGPCEGTGVVPVYGGRKNSKPGDLELANEADPELLKRWQAAEVLKPAEDGWHFVTCPACEGTGKKPGAAESARVSATVPGNLSEATPEALSHDWAATAEYYAATTSGAAMDHARDLLREVLRRDLPLPQGAPGKPGHALLVRAMAALVRSGLVARAGEASRIVLGTQKAMLEAEAQADLDQFHVLIDGPGGMAVGFVRYGLGRQVRVPGDFDAAAGEHAMTAAAREALWPGARTLWLYPVREVVALETPQAIEFTPDAAPGEAQRVRYKESDPLAVAEDMTPEAMLSLHGRLHQSWREAVALEPHRVGPADINEQHSNLERILASRGLAHPNDEDDGLDRRMTQVPAIHGFGDVYREAVYQMIRAAGEERVPIRIDEAMVAGRGRKVTKGVRMREYLTEAFCPTGKGGGSDNSCGNGKGGTATAQKPEPREKDLRGPTDPMPYPNSGIPKSEMPRIPHRAGAEFDEFLTKMGVNGGFKQADPNDLKPIQSDYRRSEVNRLKDGSEKSEATLARPLFVSRDGYIIDGHHTWMAAKEMGRHVKTLVINADKKEALKVAYGFEAPDKYMRNSFVPVVQADEAWCPTGPGGGQDNSCPPKAGGMAGAGGNPSSISKHPADKGGSDGGVHAQIGKGTHPGDVVHPGNEKTGPITAKDYKLTGVKIQVTKDNNEAASAVNARAKEVEPQITPEMKTMAEDSGGKLGRLFFEGKTTAVKGEGSLARKIATEVDDKRANGVTVSSKEAAATIKDSVRYTAVFDDDKLSAGAKAMDAKLTSSGYERVGDPKNYFAHPDSPYRGVNANYRHTRTGTVMEVQFHTQGTLDMAEKNHVEYDVWRESKVPMQIAKMELVMKDRWKGFINPPGVDKLFGGWTKKA